MSDAIPEDGETPSAIFLKFCGECGTPVCFAAVIDDGEKMRTGAAYRRDQALYIAYKLRKMAREIEADFDDPGL